MENYYSNKTILAMMETREEKAKQNWFTIKALVKTATTLYNNDHTNAKNKKDLAFWTKQEKKAWENYMSISMFIFGIKKDLEGTAGK